MSFSNTNPLAIGLGVHKCGTSWLYHMLGLHPEIHLAQRDTHFFSKQSEFEKGLDYYRRKLVLSNSGQSLALEMSNDYLASSVALERIQENFPDAKLICCLRNPIDRAFSHYRQDLKTGAVREIDFETAFRTNPSYTSNGLYAEGLKKVYALFDRTQVKVLFFDDIVSKPDVLLADLWDFLEVEAIALDAERTGSKVNAARIPKSVRLEQLQNDAYHKLRRTKAGSGLWSLARKIGLGKLVQKINRTDEKLEPMSDALRQELQNLFQDDIGETFALLDRHDLLWA